MGTKPVDKDHEKIHGSACSDNGHEEGVEGFRSRIIGRDKV